MQALGMLEETAKVCLTESQGVHGVPLALGKFFRILGLWAESSDYITSVFVSSSVIHHESLFTYLSTVLSPDTVPGS